MGETAFSRKLDTSGRIMIPIKLREIMEMIPGQVYTFSTMERNGRKYICIDCGPAVSDADFERAIQIIQASGLKVIQSDD